VDETWANYLTPTKRKVGIHDMETFIPTDCPRKEVKSDATSKEELGTCLVTNSNCGFY
jgi:hypothetical protein